MNRAQKIDLGLAVGVVASFLAGYRRLAGGIAVGAGTWYLTQHRNIAGAASLGLGGLFLAYPEWPSSLVQKLGGPSTVNVISSPPVQPPGVLVSSPNDINLGNWTLLDVRTLRDASTAARAGSLKPGDVVGVALQAPGARPVVYYAQVIAGQPPTMKYAGIWAAATPPGGPQAIDFNPEHVYSIG